MYKIKRQKQSIFDFALITYVLYTVIFSMSYVTDIIPLPESINRLIWALCLLCLTYVTVNTKYTKREFVKIAIIIIVCLSVTLVTRDDSVFMFAMFCISSKTIDLLCTMKRLYKMLMGTVFCVFFLALTGIITNKHGYGLILWDDRIYLGFKHPNFCGTILQNIALLIYLCNKGELKKRDVFIICLTWIVNFLGPKTKTCLILTCLLLLYIALLSVVGERLMSRIMKLSKYAPYIAVALTIFVIFEFRYVQQFDFEGLESIFDRMIQMSYYFNKYEVKILGQELENIAYTQVTDAAVVHTLDNGYLYLLLGKGAVFTLVYLSMLLNSLRISIKNKQHYLTFIFLLLVLWGIVETGLYRVDVVPIVLLISLQLFHRKSLE